MDPNINQQQPAQPVPPPPTPPNSLHLIKTLLISLIAVLVLSSIAAGAYFMGKNQNPTQPAAVQASPTPTPDPTANWKTYKVNTFGMEFKTPPILNKYGTLTEAVFDISSKRALTTTGEEKSLGKGKIFCMTFPPNNPGEILGCGINVFALGTVSRGIEGLGGGFFDHLQGYVFNNGKYYIKYNDKEVEEISPDHMERIINENGVEIIKIKPESAARNDFGFSPNYSPGDGAIGALINTSNQEFPGFTVSMELENGLTEEVFDQILSTFRLIK